MRRENVEHVIAAAAEILGTDRFVVIGSQAIHGTVPDPPPELTVSLEVDLYPADAPERAIEVEGALGDGSHFHSSFGYYAHAVGPETVKAPEGWQERLVAVEIPPRRLSRRQPVGLFLERHDLVLSKAVAGREHDLTFIRAAIAAHLVDITLLLCRIPDLPIDPGQQLMLRGTVESFHRDASGPRSQALRRPSPQHRIPDRR